MHPLDLMKTRFQLQGNAVPGDPGHYKGVILPSLTPFHLSLKIFQVGNCMVKMYIVQAGGAQVLLEGDCASGDGGNAKTRMEGSQSHILSFLIHISVTVLHL